MTHHLHIAVDCNTLTVKKKGSLKGQMLQQNNLYLKVINPFTLRKVSHSHLAWQNMIHFMTPQVIWGYIKTPLVYLRILTYTALNYIIEMCLLIEISWKSWQHSSSGCIDARPPHLQVVAHRIALQKLQTLFEQTGSFEQHCPQDLVNIWTYFGFKMMRIKKRSKIKVFWKLCKLVLVSNRAINPPKWSLRNQTFPWFSFLLVNSVGASSAPLANCKGAASLHRHTHTLYTHFMRSETSDTHQKKGKEQRANKLFFPAVAPHMWSTPSTNGVGTLQNGDRWDQTCWLGGNDSHRDVRGRCRMIKVTAASHTGERTHSTCLFPAHQHMSTHHTGTWITIRTVYQLSVKQQRAADIWYSSAFSRSSLQHFSSALWHTVLCASYN